MSHENLGTIETPKQIFVRCPMVEFKFRQAVKCEGCRYFGGLVTRLKKDGVSYAQLEKSPERFRSAFMVECSHPINRELYVVEIDEG